MKKMLLFLTPPPHHRPLKTNYNHYDDAIMGTVASQITCLTTVYSTVYSGADQRKHQSTTSLAFVRGIHRGPVNSPHKWPVTRKMFPFDDVIMFYSPCVRQDTPTTVSDSHSSLKNSKHSKYFDSSISGAIYKTALVHGISYCSII